jgi:hypothetical protein
MERVSILFRAGNTSFILTNESLRIYDGPEKWIGDEGQQRK